jgi:signal transduction histidine kinase/DNA-binding NarL/FixJ family response regulator
MSNGALQYSTMPISSLTSQPRLRFGTLAQRLLLPHPLWGVVLGGLAAVALWGSASLVSALRGGSWGSIGLSVAAWTMVAGVLVAVSQVPAQLRRLAQLAMAGSLGVLAVMLGARVFGALPLNPTLPLTVLLGGIAGRLAFGRWERHAGRQLALRQSQLRAAVSSAKADFLSQLTREMRTPVNAVVGVADLLTETGLDGEQRRHLVVFRRSAESLTLLLEDLADLARLEAGRVTLKSADIALPGLLHEQIAQVRDEAQAKGLQIQLTLAKNTPRIVRGDPQRLGQALSHLLSHSVRATRQGRIAVEVRPSPRDDDLVRFVITDTSLSPVTGTLAGILEPFSSAAADRLRKGSGIGMALVRGLAEMMGGRLSVRHTPGRGTTTVFSAVLPAAGDSGPVSGVADVKHVAAAPGSQTIQAPMSILLVDDNVSTSELIESMLDKQRFTVVRCRNGREALQALEIAPFDVVLMDLNMPELDGWSALRILRRQEAERRLPRTPVVALGTAPLEIERQRCLDAGFDDHLCKPLRKSRLLETVGRLAPEGSGTAQPAAAATEDLRPDQRDALAMLGRDGLIDVRAAVESLGGDATLYLDAIEHLVPALANWPSRFQDALNRADFERARQMALDMQSILDVVAASPCATALGRMAEALGAPEDAATRTAALAELDRQLQPLMRVLQQTLDCIRSARQERLRREQGHNSAF